MHKVTINDYTCYIPSSWDELNLKQLHIIIRQFFVKPVENDFRLKVLLSFLNLKVMRRDPVPDPANKKNNLYILNRKGFPNFFVGADQLAALFPVFDFLFETHEDENKNQRIISSQLTLNLMPTFEHKGIVYYGPSEKLFNLKFDEYIVCETNYIEYLKTQDTGRLDKLIATLYRPRDPEADPDKLTYRGDLREPFNDFLIDGRAKKLSSTAPEVKFTVFFFYQGCRNFLTRQFSNVFTTTGNDSSNQLGFMGLVDSLTGGDVTKADQVRKSYLYDIMVHLEQAIINNEKMKEELKKHKS